VVQCEVYGTQNAAYEFNREERCRSWGSHRRGPTGAIVERVRQVWRKTMNNDRGHNRPRYNAAYTYALFLPYKRIFLAPPTICPTLFLSADLDSWHGKPNGLPQRNMLARTSDTLGFGVCRAVPITPRRIPSVTYLLGRAPVI